MDSIYLYDKYGSPMAYDSWRHVRRVIDWVADNWMNADDGIWEVRGGQQQFTYSKVQCWVALDRAIRLATKRSLPLDRTRLLAERDRIYEAGMTHSWDADRRALVQYVGTDAPRGRGAGGVRAVFRHRCGGCGQPHHAAGVLHLAERPAHDRNARSHNSGAGFRQPGASL